MRLTATLALIDYSSNTEFNLIRRTDGVVQVATFVGDINGRSRLDNRHNTRRFTRVSGATTARRAHESQRGSGRGLEGGTRTCSINVSTLRHRRQSRQQTISEQTSKTTLCDRSMTMARTRCDWLRVTMVNNYPDSTERRRRPAAVSDVCSRVGCICLCTFGLWFRLVGVFANNDDARERLMEYLLFRTTTTTTTATARSKTKTQHTYAVVERWSSIGFFSSTSGQHHTSSSAAQDPRRVLYGRVFEILRARSRDKEDWIELKAGKKQRNFVFLRWKYIYFARCDSDFWFDWSCWCWMVSAFGCDRKRIESLSSQFNYIVVFRPHRSGKL